VIRNTRMGFFMD